MYYESIIYIIFTIYKNIKKLTNNDTPTSNHGNFMRARIRLAYF